DEEHYAERVDMTGFSGGDRVLDIGCGYGQWAVQLARHNGHVLALDRLDTMAECARILFEKYGITNAEAGVASLPALPDLPDEGFDYIWCWGVYMFTPRAETLTEFNRLLRPGGRFLMGSVSTKGNWRQKYLSTFNPFQPTLMPRKKRRAMIKKVFEHGGELNARPNFTSREMVPDLCERFGFRLIAVDRDGYIDLAGKGRRKPMFRPSFLGMDNTIEWIAEKVRDIEHPYREDKP
ncbi:MAG: class I SAM-dependent methyltransferase, partial [Phycisphaerales bacterium]|nr:class I SAM-dependent methyltransferase [Phycisphaerales bacterium]